MARLAGPPCVAYLLSLLFGKVNGYHLEKRQVSTGITLNFMPIDSLETCEAAELSWFYLGPTDAFMHLWVTQEGSDDVAMALSNRVAPGSTDFTWIVNVGPGRYTLHAAIPDHTFSRQSAVFEIVAGESTACIVSPYPPSGSHTATTPAADASTIPSNAAGALPSTTESRPRTGMIVGISLGCLALLMVFVAAYFFLRRKSKHIGGKSGFSRGWNGLASSDSRAGFGGKAAPGQKGHMQDCRLAARRSRLNVASLGSIMMGSTEDTIACAESEEKLGGGQSRKNSMLQSYDSYDDNPLALAQLPTLHHHHHPSSRDSRTDLGMKRNISGSSYGMDEVISAPKGRRSSFSETPGGVIGGERGRRASIDSRHHLRNNTALTAGLSVSRTPSLATSATHAHAAEVASPTNPTSPSAEAKKVHRNSIGRTKRKPVPTYDVSDNPLPTSSPSSPVIISQPSSSTSISPLGGSVDQSHHSNRPSPSPQAQSVSGHYSTRAASRPGTSTGEGDGLYHKSSFGNGAPGDNGRKQMHYLMPDLPPDVHKR